MLAALKVDPTSALSIHTRKLISVPGALIPSSSLVGNRHAYGLYTCTQRIYTHKTKIKP